MKTLHFFGQKHCFFKKSFLGVAVSAALALQVGFCAAQGTVTEHLADQPIGSQEKVPPTIMFTVDDSASMTSFFSPENLTKYDPNESSGTKGHYFSKKLIIDGKEQLIKKPYLYYLEGMGGVMSEKEMQTEGGVEVGIPYYYNFIKNYCQTISECWSSWQGEMPKTLDDYKLSLFFHHGIPDMLDPSINKLAYNPEVNYLPPQRADGSSYPNMTDFSNVVWSTTDNWNDKPFSVNFNDPKFVWHYPASFFSDNKIMMPNSDDLIDPTTYLSDYVNPNGGYDLPPHYFLGKHLFILDFAHEKKIDIPSETILKETLGGNTNSRTGSDDFSIQRPSSLASYSAKEQELINYANWAAYYRNRVAATKTAASLAFANLCPDGINPVTCAAMPRVGFATINGLANKTNQALAPDAFSPGSTQRSDFFKTLFDSDASGQTPLLNAVDAVGKDFSDSSKNYILQSCQRNYDILFTDGLWNDGYKTDYNTFPIPPDSSNPVSSMDFTNLGTNSVNIYGQVVTPNASAFPKLISAYGGKAGDQSLANVALHYWMTDLRPDLDNDVSPSGYDNATWQHMNFIGMGFGVSGSLPASTDQEKESTLNAIANGNSCKLNGKTLNICSWPEVDLDSEDETSKVDDLWHATINSMQRGDFTTANSPEEFKNALSAILKRIMSLQQTSAGAGISNLNLASDFVNDFAFVPWHGGSWAGDVEKYRLDNEGNATQTDTTPQQEQYPTASEQLNVLLAKALDQNDSCYSPESSALDDSFVFANCRTIFTDDGNTYGSYTLGTTEVPFTYSSLKNDPTMADELSSLTTSGSSVEEKNVINYLRGDSALEGKDPGEMRSRMNNKIGDIWLASPIVVSTPFCYDTGGATDKNNNPVGDGKITVNECEMAVSSYLKYYCDETAGTYVDDKSGTYCQIKKDLDSGRGTMVYVPANDGMLHAFDSSLNEKWAFIPRDLLREQSEAGIINLTYQENDAQHPFVHYAYVNATPRYWDVQFSDGSWHSMLVGGLGKGGTSYYAFDVTDGNLGKNISLGKNSNVPGDRYEKPILKWEFTDDNMGYTFGRPTFAVTNAWKNTWVAILPSGYENGTGDYAARKPAGHKGLGNGQACLFFVNIETGKPMTVGTNSNGMLCAKDDQDASKSDPANMAYITAYTKTEDSQLATAVYGGDEHGNLWRFDISSSDTSKWNAIKIGKMQINGQDQYVTTEPFVLRTDSRRYIAIGTGGFRNSDDLYSTMGNTMYVFRDGGADDPDKTLDGNNPRVRGDMAQVLYSNSNAITDASELAKIKNAGWYMDLPTSPSVYHVNVNPNGAAYDLVFAANRYTVLKDDTGTMYSEDSCKTAAYESMIFSRDIRDGSSTLKTSSSSGTGGTGTGSTSSPLAYVSEPGGIAGFSIVRTPNGLKIIGSTSDSQIKVEGSISPITLGASSLLRSNIRYIHTIN
jgi:type IV pilus assembly protein PilY1